MPRRFPVYAKLLGLYPKLYRQEYGEQMKQTLADMLDDEPNRLGRIYIWAQVGLDLPFTALHQNLIAKKGHSMQKHFPRMNKRAFIISLVIIILLGVAGAYQFGRSTVVPGVARVVYGGGMRSVYEHELSALGDPSKSLLGSHKMADTRCVSQYEGVRVHVDCSVSLQNYGLLPQDDKGKKSTIEAANALETSLTQSGYQTGVDGYTNGVTVRSLVTGTYEGKDYSPDAYYAKKIGDVFCSFQITIAYSNPKPPAINMVHSCVSLFNIFGEPALTKAAELPAEVKG